MSLALASITSFIDAHSQWALLLLFTLLTLESFGLPVPGETALIACSVLTSQGSLSNPIATYASLENSRKLSQCFGCGTRSPRLICET